MTRIPPSLTRLLAAVALVLLHTAANADELHSYAKVNEDGSLLIENTLVRLYGIYIPETDRTCETYRQPPVCGPRAALALNFIIQGFVLCDIIGENDYGESVGWCRVGATAHERGTDLSAYLLERGWAVALPVAGVEYKTLEEMARARGLGIWGTPADVISNQTPW